MLKWIRSLNGMGYNFRYVFSLQQMECFYWLNCISIHSGSEQRERRGMNELRNAFQFTFRKKWTLNLWREWSGTHADANELHKLKWNMAAGASAAFIEWFVKRITKWMVATAGPHSSVSFVIINSLHSLISLLNQLAAR